MATRKNKNSQNQRLVLLKKVPSTSLLTNLNRTFPSSSAWLLGGYDTTDHAPLTLNELWDIGLLWFSSFSESFFLHPFLQVKFVHVEKHPHCYPRWGSFENQNRVTTILFPRYLPNCPMPSFLDLLLSFFLSFSLCSFCQWLAEHWRCKGEGQQSLAWRTSQPVICGHHSIYLSTLCSRIFQTQNQEGCSSPQWLITSFSKRGHRNSEREHHLSKITSHESGWFRQWHPLNFIPNCCLHHKYIV